MHIRPWKPRLLNYLRITSDSNTHLLYLRRDMSACVAIDDRRLSCRNGAANRYSLDSAEI
jgi:hypothetical protein